MWGCGVEWVFDEVVVVGCFWGYFEVGVFGWGYFVDEFLWDWLLWVFGVIFWNCFVVEFGEDGCVFLGVFVEVVGVYFIDVFFFFL